MQAFTVKTPPPLCLANEIIQNRCSRGKVLAALPEKLDYLQVPRLVLSFSCDGKYLKMYEEFRNIYIVRYLDIDVNLTFSSRTHLVQREFTLEFGVMRDGISGCKLRNLPTFVAPIKSIYALHLNHLK